MNQRYVDRFRSNLGTSAMMALDKFFNSSPIYKRNDAARAEYAHHMLWNNRFLYAKAKKDDANVRCHLYSYFYANGLILALDWGISSHIYNPSLFSLFQHH